MYESVSIVTPDHGKLWNFLSEIIQVLVLLENDLKEVSLAPVFINKNLKLIVISLHSKTISFIRLILNIMCTKIDLT